MTKLLPKTSAYTKEGKCLAKQLTPERRLAIEKDMGMLSKRFARRTESFCRALFVVYSSVSSTAVNDHSTLSWLSRLVPLHLKLYVATHGASSPSQGTIEPSPDMAWLFPYCLSGVFRASI